MTPRISVITAVFNGARVLERCIESVKAQAYPALDHIVIDGGSTDGTADIIRRKQDALYAWLSEPDRGVYDAWNKGLALARGEWVAFLGADDVYLPGALRAYVEAAQRHPAAEYISSRIELSYPGGGRRITGKPWRWSDFRAYMCTAHPGSLHRATLFRDVGKYDISYRIAGDYELLLRRRDRLQAAFVDAVTARMDVGGVSDSAAALVEARRAKVRHGARGLLAATADQAIAFAKRQYRRHLWRPETANA